MIVKNNRLAILRLNWGYKSKNCPWHFGVPSGTGLYLTLYPQSSPNTDTTYVLSTWDYSNESKWVKINLDYSKLHAIDPDDLNSFVTDIHISTTLGPEAVFPLLEYKW